MRKVIEGLTHNQAYRWSNPKKARGTRKSVQICGHVEEDKRGKIENTLRQWEYKHQYQKNHWQLWTLPSKLQDPEDDEDDVDPSGLAQLAMLTTTQPTMQ